MNKIHKHRLYVITFVAIGVSLAAGLILYALKQNINVFVTPHQLQTQTIAQGYHFRLGGLVKEGTVKRDKASLVVEFTVTDLKKEILVRYIGTLPDLFREGKGVVAEGKLDKQGIFVADTVLAKHDENYMPKNVYNAIREQTA